MLNIKLMLSIIACNTGCPENAQRGFLMNSKQKQSVTFFGVHLGKTYRVSTIEQKCRVLIGALRHNYILSEYAQIQVQNVLLCKVTTILTVYLYVHYFFLSTVLSKKSFALPPSYSQHPCI